MSDVLSWERSPEETFAMVRRDVEAIAARTGVPAPTRADNLLDYTWEWTCHLYWARVMEVPNLKTSALLALIRRFGVPRFAGGYVADRLARGQQGAGADLPDGEPLIPEWSKVAYGGSRSPPRNGTVRRRVTSSYDRYRAEGMTVAAARAATAAAHGISKSTVRNYVRDVREWERAVLQEFQIRRSDLTS
jgi:hypothetical protein